MLSPRKHVSSELKSKILAELSSSVSSAPAVAKKYGLRSKRLYQWRSKANQLHKNDDLSSNKKDIAPLIQFCRIIGKPRILL